MRITSGLKIILVLALVASLTACASRPSRNPYWDAQDYVVSGRYMNDIRRVETPAQFYILTQSAHIKNPAIVLDIDETSLSNWPELAANRLVFRMDGPCAHLPQGPCGLEAWQQQARAAAIIPTLDLFQVVRRKEIAVFFLTGRDETLRTATVQNLKRTGFADWTGLIMRPAGTTTPSAADYKAPARAKIEAMGYTVVATIGDQQSDLDGGHAMAAFKLPNPFYTIP